MMRKCSKNEKEFKSDKQAEYAEMSECKPSASASKWMKRPAYGGCGEITEKEKEAAEVTKEKFVGEWKTKMQETMVKKPEQEAAACADGEPVQKPKPVKAEFSEPLSAERLKKRVLIALGIPEPQIMTVHEVINLFMEKINDGELTTSSKVMVNILIDRL